MFHHGICRMLGACDVLAVCGKFNGLCFVYGVQRLELTIMLTASCVDIGYVTFYQKLYFP